MLTGGRARKAKFTFDLYRKGIWIDSRTFFNIVPNESLDEGLGVEYDQQTAISAHYVIIVETNTTPAAGMTYASPTFTECTAYSESTRPLWQNGSVSGQAITNSSNPAAFTMTATKTIYGGGLVGGGTAASTKGDTAGGGTLKHYGLASASIACVATDVLYVTIAITGSDVP